MRLSICDFPKFTRDFCATLYSNSQRNSLRSWKIPSAMVTSKILSFLDFSENQAIQTLVTKKWNLLRKSSIDEIFFLRFSEEQSICQHFFRSCHNFCQINFQKASLLAHYIRAKKVSKYFPNKNCNIIGFRMSKKLTMSYLTVLRFHT